MDENRRLAPISARQTYRKMTDNYTIYGLTWMLIIVCIMIATFITNEKDG